MNIHVDQGHRPLPIDYPFESRVLSLLEIRKQAGDEIERLLALLDEIDSDPDLEDNDDRERVCEDEGAQCDDEGDDTDREHDFAETGVADADAAQEYKGEIAALRAFEEDRAARRAGRPVRPCQPRGAK